MTKQIECRFIFGKNRQKIQQLQKAIYHHLNIKLATFRELDEFKFIIELKRDIELLNGIINSDDPNIKTNVFHVSKITAKAFHIDWQSRAPKSKIHTIIIPMDNVNCIQSI